MQSRPRNADLPGFLLRIWVALSLAAPAAAHAQMPDGRLLWSMDSLYVLVTVNDGTGLLERRGLTNRVWLELQEHGITVTDAATPTVVVQTTVKRAASPPESGESAWLMHLQVAVTDNVTRVKYVDAALTRCMSAEGCRRNVSGARALGSPAILWQQDWLGSEASADRVPDAIGEQLDAIVSRFLRVHASANQR